MVRARTDPHRTRAAAHRRLTLRSTPASRRARRAPTPLAPAAGKSYQEQLNAAIAKTGEVCAVTVRERNVGGAAPLALAPPSPSEAPPRSSLPARCAGIRLVWCEHNFGFMGGSLGCAEGERVTRAFEHATQNRIPIVINCKTGGARMQEGLLSLMQMAKVSVAVEAHRRQRLPFISLLQDPTYGGVSASYAMQADVRISVAKARIGFAGPEVIMNTMCEASQPRYDKECPERFQSAEFLLENGQLDIVVTPEEGQEQQAAIEEAVAGVLRLLHADAPPKTGAPKAAAPPSEAELKASPDYLATRAILRPQAQDVMERVFSDFVELKVAWTPRCLSLLLASRLPPLRLRISIPSRLVSLAPTGAGRRQGGRRPVRARRPRAAGRHALRRAGHVQGAQPEGHGDRQLRHALTRGLPYRAAPLHAR